jgi:hypothetical protein
VRVTEYDHAVEAVPSQNLLGLRNLVILRRLCVRNHMRATRLTNPPAATGFGQVRTGTVAASQMTQYCIPPRDNPDAHRFYCGNEDGWADPTGAAFRLLHAGGRGKSLAA